MRTNFFQAIQRLHPTGAWIINACFSAEHEMIVSILLKASGTEENQGQLSPMVFRGTAQEIDEGILEGLLQPISETASLFANVSAYNRGLAEAREKLAAKPKAEKTAVAKPSAADAPENPIGETATEKPKFEDVLKEIGRLNSNCKYADAVAILPSAEDYPDKKAEIEKLAKDLEWRMKQLTLL